MISLIDLKCKSFIHRITRFAKTKRVYIVEKVGYLLRFSYYCLALVIISVYFTRIYEGIFQLLTIKMCYTLTRKRDEKKTCVLFIL